MRIFQIFDLFVKMKYIFTLIVTKFLCSFMLLKRIRKQPLFKKMHTLFFFFKIEVLIVMILECIANILAAEY